MNDTVKYSNLFNFREKLPRVMTIKSMITYAVPFTLPELIEKNEENFNQVESNSNSNTPKIF